MAQTETNHPEQNNLGRLRARYLANLIIISLTALAAAACALFFLLRSRTAYYQLRDLNDMITGERGQPKLYFTQEELSERMEITRAKAVRGEYDAMLVQIKNAFQSGDSGINVLRRMYSDELVVSDGERYYFESAGGNVARSGFRPNDFILEGGRMLYRGENLAVSALQGVSADAETGTDWAEAAQDGIRFAVVTAGMAGADGETEADETFSEYASEIRANGLAVIVSYDIADFPGCGRTGIPESDPEAAQAELPADGEETEFHLGALEQVPDLAGCRVILRIPEPDGEPQDAEERAALQRERTEYVNRLAAQVRQLGFRPVISADLYMLICGIDLAGLEDAEICIRDHGSSLYYPYAFRMWEYTHSGEVRGVEGPARMFLFLESQEKKLDT